jgi:hypothetical protein
MNYRQTKHQVARGAFPDAQQQNKIFLFKNVSSLRATYQIRLLTYLASEAGNKLIIDVPHHFVPHSSLSSLMREFPKTIQIKKASQ